MNNNLLSINLKKNIWVSVLCTIALILLTNFYPDKSLRSNLFFTFLLLLFNSTAAVSFYELNIKDFFYHHLPISKAKLVMSKIYTVLLTSVPILFVLLIITVRSHEFNFASRQYPGTKIFDVSDIFETKINGLYIYIICYLFVMMLIPMIFPVIVSLYFRSSKIISFFMSFIAAVTFKYIVIYSFQYPIIPDLNSGWDVTVNLSYSIYAFAKTLIFLAAFVFWGIYLYQKTELVEKPSFISTLLGIEFILISSWIVIILGSADYYELFYLIFG